MKTSVAPRLKGWAELCQLAQSRQKAQRAGVIGIGYSWVKHALDAAGIPRSKNSDEDNTGYRLMKNSRLLADVTKEDVRQVIRIRRLLGERGEVPDAAICLKTVETMRDIWHALNYQFVNIDSAIDLARRISQKVGVSKVCLYGSMARDHENPNDIDLLVLDDGTYSETVEFGKYDDGSFSPVRQTTDYLDALEMGTYKLGACALCRWLDVRIIDGTRFGADFAYTNDLQTAQPDPWFFVNIARDILTFNREGFDDDPPFPFADLRRVYDFLYRFGFYLTPEEVLKLQNKQADANDGENPEEEDGDGDDADEKDDPDEDT